ncbi:MAG: 4-hydroxyphenylpyruvate dioxygenase [Acidimicrobiia bacterium]|nr:4-hydroxyphenylpyruvate dioxygenase [Acidimicrobiia bacterium]MBT8213784.1 4-hydroxyphenylpyruvate dioxygenase [Acidimicrobiia bacterium]NNK92685.1 4-hydroxyphenylpyruvate dioxygenase [Acidimicrobiia bacterium]
MTDLMPLKGYDYIEFYVGNALQAAHYYRTAFGFDIVGYAGPETGVRDRASYVLQQNDLRFVLTAGLHPGHEVTEHHHNHGDGVKDVAFTVPDAEQAFEVALERGATGSRKPEVLEDEHGRIVVSAIHAYGDTIHTFVERSEYDGLFMPGYRSVADRPPASSMGLRYVDHVVCNVELGAMDEWAGFYAQVMGFTQLHHFDDEAISTDYTALMSKVLWDGEGRIKLPINEPADGKKKSQIEEYLDFYHAPGVQHMALATDDIVATVSAMRDAGVKFLEVPDTYYEDLRERLDWSTIDADIDELARLGVLVDQDDEGYLLQLFTENVQERPTVFYEVIERHGSRGFGLGNFKALFEAIERAQAERGNL